MEREFYLRPEVSLFDEDESSIDWYHWEEMPEYVLGWEKPHRELRITFNSMDEVKELSEKLGQKITDRTLSFWYPPMPRRDLTKSRYICPQTEDYMPRYPLYIPSKGRFEKRLTSDALIKMGVKHYIVVEESQYEDYLKRVDPNFVTILILDQKYLDEYETCDDLGSTKSKGPGAARNFAWDHSISMGYKRHWVMDDNIKDFYRMNDSLRIKTTACSIWRAMEDHTDRFENVLMSGPNYNFFNIPDMERPPFQINTRIYSCNLILNDVPYRWRGRYNEDTDISLRMLKDGFCTIQYNAFMQGKLVTQAMKGGNTEEFYSKEGTLPKSKMLEYLHPDVSRVMWRYGRWHHFVDYKPFEKNKLVLKKDINLKNEINNYGMELKEL